MNKKKVGIVTHYYNSCNYGGNLQAYALCKFLNKCGYDAEQIAFKRDESIILKIKRKIKKLIPIFNFNTYIKINKRNNAILKFNKNCIPHSKVFKEKNLYKANNYYNFFITGSDQVWHPNALCDAFLLKFVKKHKKISYAASISKNKLNNNELKIFEEALSDYSGISVREKDAVDLLKNVTDKQIECTLDPTLLLDYEDWNSLSEEIETPQNYFFCYFLGENIEARNLANIYAKNNNLKIITLPNLMGSKRKCDKNFGDIKLYNVSPQQFLYLIKNANIIFTDSFHGSVFSLIFKKDFFVFNRYMNGSMSSRLYSLCDLYNVNNQFINNNENQNIKYIEKNKKIDYNNLDNKINIEKKKSIDFLLNKLKD